MRMRATIRTIAIHAPMIPHISASDSPDEPRAPTLGPPGPGPVVVSVVGVVGGGVAKITSKSIRNKGIKVDLILLIA